MTTVSDLNTNNPGVTDAQNNSTNVTNRSTEPITTTQDTSVVEQNQTTMAETTTGTIYPVTDVQSKMTLDELSPILIPIIFYTVGVGQL